MSVSVPVDPLMMHVYVHVSDGRSCQDVGHIVNECNAIAAVIVLSQGIFRAEIPGSCESKCVL